MCWHTRVCVANSEPDGKARSQYWHGWFFRRFFLFLVGDSLVGPLQSSSFDESSVLTSTLFSTSNVERSPLTICSVSLQRIQLLICHICQISHFKVHFTIRMRLKMSCVIIHLSKSGATLFAVIFDERFCFGFIFNIFILFCWFKWTRKLRFCCGFSFSRCELKQ